MLAEHNSWRKQVLKILLINDFRSSEKNSSFYVKASKNLLFVSKSSDPIFFWLSLSPIKSIFIAFYVENIV